MSALLLVSSEEVAIRPVVTTAGHRTDMCTASPPAVFFSSPYNASATYEDGGAGEGSGKSPAYNASVPYEGG
jgi:hypothetical protein